MSRDSKLHAAPFLWKVPGFPTVTLLERAMDGIARDVMDVFGRVPRRGAETGGILLGIRSHEGVVIEGYAPISSEHRFGRLYRLSDFDKQSLRESLEAVNGNRSGLQAVGLYRSNAREEFTSTIEDAECQAAHFPEDERLLLLIQPSRSGPSEADFFFWRDGGMKEAFRPFEFPFREMPEDAADASKIYVPAAHGATRRMVQLPNEAATPAAPAVHTSNRAWLRSPPCSAPQRAVDSKPAAQYATLFEPKGLASSDPAAEDSSSTKWWGWTVAAALLLGAGVVGIRYDFAARPAVVPEASLPARPPVSAPESAPVAAPVAAPMESAPAPPAPEETKPVIQSRDRQAAEPSESDVRNLLERWASAIRRGDVEQAAALYLPQARQRGRDSIRDLLHGRRKMEVFRLNSIAVTSPERGQSAATFRERWQTGGYPRSSGEEQVRLLLKRNGDRWQIASREAQQIWILQAQ